MFDEDALTILSIPQPRVIINPREEAEVYQAFGGTLSGNLNTFANMISILTPVAGTKFRLQGWNIKLMIKTASPSAANYEIIFLFDGSNAGRDNIAPVSEWFHINTAAGTMLCSETVYLPPPGRLSRLKDNVLKLGGFLDIGVGQILASGVVWGTLE